MALATENQIRTLLNPGLLRAVYDHKFPWPKQQTPPGAVTGRFHFGPSATWMTEFKDLIWEPALRPLSRIPLADIVALDLPAILLPSATEPEYPELALGLITLLDQARLLLGEGYNIRYMRGFFDPVAEKIARQLILPYSTENTTQPDHLQAWLSRGYNVDDWLARVLWFWGPLVHSDSFMVENRAVLKAFLHDMRAQVENHCGYADPFKELEAQDDVDLTLFSRMFIEQPPLTTYEPSSRDRDEAEVPGATMSDYAFWWIRILNAHFAITDKCGHYPFWLRAIGGQWDQNDEEYMALPGSQLFAAGDEATLRDIRNDVSIGAWRSLV